MDRKSTSGVCKFAHALLFMLLSVRCYIVQTGCACQGLKAVKRQTLLASCLVITHNCILSTRGTVEKNDLYTKLEVHSVERIYLRQRCFDASKPRVTAATGAQYGYVIKFCVAAHTLWEKAIRFWHPDYDPDRAQKLISSSMSWTWTIRNIFKSMHAFLSNLAHRQSDRRTQARGRKHNTSAVVGGK